MIKFNPILHGTPGSWDRQRKPHGGGDGGGSYYENANRLYGIQADTAQFMLDYGKKYLPGAVADYSNAVSEINSPAYEAKAVGQAQADAQAAIDTNRQSMGRDLARYGINPNSGRFADMENSNAIQGAAIQAGAMNNARDFVRNKRFGVSKDFYSSLVGMNSDAAAQAGSAGSNFANLGNMKQNQQNQEDAAWGSAVGMGAALAFKDGGEIKIEPRKMAAGGLFGGASMAAPLPSSTAAPQRSPMSGVSSGIKAGKQALGATDKGGMIANKIGNFIGNDELASWGAGRSAAAEGINVAPAAQAYQDAGMTAQAQGLIQGSSTVSGMPGVAAGSEQAAALAAQTGDMGAGAAALVNDSLASSAGAGAGAAAAGGAAAAEGAGAAAAGSTAALEALSTAMPWVGVGAAIGSALGLFKDGGAVDGSKGGAVNGPGSETSDSVNAKLSKGEFVENAESVKMSRKDVMPVVKDWMKTKGNTNELLHKINAAGLAKRYGVM